MITLNCPDCGEKYELDDEMAGKKAACNCGAVLFVPQLPDAPEGSKFCPTCKSVTDEDSIICVSCGYNFETGGRMRSAESRVKVEEDPKITLLRRLWKPLLLLFVIIIIGVVVYNSFFAKHYGISSSNPLGLLSSIEEHLQNSGYSKVKDKEDDKVPEVFGKSVKKIEYKDVKLDKASKGMFSEKVFIIVSKENKVLAIGANFKGGVKTIPGDTGSRSGRFMSSFWKDAGLKLPPEYKHIEEGEGRWSFSYEKANASVNDIRAEWIEYTSDISIIPSSHTMIITYSKFPDVSYSDVQGKRFEQMNIEEIRSEIKEKSNKDKTPENPKLNNTEK